ncbi:MAG: D-sedoheptulose 7-phosphate isomerase [Acidobacteria bacterium]|jgi:D-sedoheptulose 7-phosphate isomerase|nr:D-sedoheptulose 7-phosphate isomerase [Acidobacteriota bacterium]
MASDFAEVVLRTLAAAVRLHEQAQTSSVDATVAATELMVASLRSGGKILVCGNGGSASDSQHFAAELVGRFERERRALPSIALTTDTSILTAIGNDYAYDRVFARQVEAIGRAGDVLLGISTSGGSRNVLEAFGVAKAGGLTTVALTGRDGGLVGAAADIHVNVPSPSTARVQEVHRTLMHAMCELIERELYA